ncbi:MAG: hypothetical protein KKC79_17935 [Gammaproteobacteria bacterium]|nr:hypothetical protein [Gammaproteobacteria bacterium]MBU1440473.1 hypothetical protein [Gammaproteobacteria bacterium]MBU2287304.1 hypothetical protein [Gammaproteobacteria bacterium]MBU2410517.1 hypothetical protein [Gammaproteobacteria bacterium]
MALLDSRVLRAVIAALFGIAFAAVCLTGWWAYTHWRPIWDVEKAVAAKLGNASGSDFDHVTFNRATGVGCGFVELKAGASAAGAPGPGKAHFILFPTGELKFEPRSEEVKGPASDAQVEALKNRIAYSKLIESNCLR